MVGHWNQYFNALIYLTKEELFPLQLFLRNILIVDQSAEMLSSDPEALNEFCLSPTAKAKHAVWLGRGIHAANVDPLSIYAEIFYKRHYAWRNQG